MGGSLNLWKMLPTAAIGAAAFTLTTGSAHAFFPPLPTGSNTVAVSPVSPAPILPVSPTIPVPPVDPPIVPPVAPPVVPPVPPPPFVPPPPPPGVTPEPPVELPAEVPVSPCSCVETPQTVPEPTTMLSGLIGLGVLGGLGWKRRQRHASKK